MSEQNPEVGDVWTFASDPPAEAVIVSELAGANGFQLMSRTGRIINVTRPSLRHIWRYTGTTHQGPCSIGGCLLPAGIRVREAWFCGAHAPRNQPLELPGDAGQPQVAVTQGALGQCPSCGTARDPQSSMTMIEDLTIHRCSCRARWIALLAQGIPEDGINLGEDLQAAHTLLENEFCSPIRAFVGSTALAALQRTFREIKDTNPTFAGIPLTPGPQYGSDTLLLVGTPLSSHDEESEYDKLLGTFWRHNELNGLICRVYGAEEATRNDRLVQISHWDDERQVLSLPEAHLLRDFSPSESPRITRFENGSVAIQHPPEFVGSMPLPTEVQIDAPSILTTAQLSDDSEKKPQIGETWWNVSTGKPVQVFGTGRTPAGLEYTRVTYEDGTSARQLSGDFAVYHASYDTNETEILVDREYQRSDGTVWTLRAVAMPILNLEGANGVTESVRILDFRARYKIYVRRSALDRLLDVEDLV